MKKKMQKGALLTMGVLGATGGLEDMATFGMTKKPEKKKYPFSDIELMMLEKLSGKGKKSYVKKLKEKYAGKN